MKSRRKRISRRNFLFKGGVAAIAALAASVTPAMAAKASKKKPAKEQAPPPEPAETLSAVDVTLTLNGRKKTLTIPTGRTLAEVLRYDLGMKGTKIGCGSAECGACTVLVNGRPVYSCSFLAVLADQSWVETVEGLAPSEDKLHPIQSAFIEQDALQCGYCTPGMICATKALLSRSPNPSDEEIREGLSGNLCRCGAYRNIVEAVKAAANKS